MRQRVELREPDQVFRRLQTGEIIAQFRVPLSPDDTVDDIAEKEHQLEMEHFPKVVEEILKEGVSK